jgi:hypothetical protein
MPKIVGEIIKNGQTYKFEPVEQENLYRAYNELLKVATGRDYFETREVDVVQIIDLGDKPYDHVKVYYEKSAEPEIEPPKVEESPTGDGKKTIFRNQIMYLGQKLLTRAQHVTRDGVGFAMLLDVDGRDPLAALSEEGYTQVLSNAVQSQGFYNPILVAPPGQMDEEDRETYLEEYVEATVQKANEEKDRKGKNATAYFDWSKPDYEDPKKENENL